MRSSNEDTLSVDGAIIPHEELQEFLLTGDTDHLLLVADGMGGHAKGEVASQLALASMNASWRRSHPEFDPAPAIRRANERVYAEMARDHTRRGMGATLAGLHLRSVEGCWFNVGDSRLYHYRAGRLRQVSVDHVPRADTIAGRARSHRITQAIGGGHAPVDVQPAVGVVEFYRGDRILLCTDGLTDVLADQEIATINAECATVSETAIRLKAAVFDAGAPDNVTCLLLERAG
ncbi:MAG: protein phosphatase 2C domain-containing protein [Caulobacteraceae bacterium]